MRVVLCHYGQTAKLLFSFGLGNVLHYSLLHTLFLLVNLLSLTQLKRVCRNAHFDTPSLIRVFTLCLLHELCLSFVYLVLPASAVVSNADDDDSTLLGGDCSLAVNGACGDRASL